jgi:hypothetical protein
VQIIYFIEKLLLLVFFALNHSYYRGYLVMNI